jgi:hypothetical protein
MMEECVAKQASSFFYLDVQRSLGGTTARKSGSSKSTAAA